MQRRVGGPGDEAEAELAGYAAKGFTVAKMRVVGRDGFSITNCMRRVNAARSVGVFMLDCSTMSNVEISLAS